MSIKCCSKEAGGNREVMFGSDVCCKYYAKNLEIRRQYGVTKRILRRAEGIWDFKRMEQTRMREGRGRSFPGIDCMECVRLKLRQVLFMTLHVGVRA